MVHLRADVPTGGTSMQMNLHEDILQTATPPCRGTSTMQFHADAPSWCTSTQTYPKAAPPRSYTSTQLHLLAATPPRRGTAHSCTSVQPYPCACSSCWWCQDHSGPRARPRSLRTAGRTPCRRGAGGLVPCGAVHARAAAGCWPPASHTGSSHLQFCNTMRGKPQGPQKGEEGCAKQQSN